MAEYSNCDFFCVFCAAVNYLSEQRGLDVDLTVSSQQHTTKKKTWPCPQKKESLSLSLSLSLYSYMSAKDKTRNTGNYNIQVAKVKGHAIVHDPSIHPPKDDVVYPLNTSGQDAGQF